MNEDSFEQFVLIDDRKMIQCTLLPYPLDKKSTNKLKLLGAECNKARIKFETETNKTKKRQLRDSYSDTIKELREHEKALRKTFGIASIRSY